MRVIGVLDLRRGGAVHARAGQRDEYLPVRAVARRSIPAGDPIALASAYCERLRLADLYIADLDALTGRPPQDALVAAIASAVRASILVDAAVTSAERAD